MLGKILRSGCFYSPSPLYSITLLLLGTILVSGHVYDDIYVDLGLSAF